MPEPLRLLLVEDDPDTAALIQETLEDHFGKGCVRHSATLADGKRADVGATDLVLSDMNLPDGSGLELLSHLLLRRPDLPVIFVTAEGIVENAMRAIRQGAYDYIIKAGDYLFTVPVMVEKNLAIWRTKQDNQRLQEELTRTLEEVRIKNDQLEKAVHQLETMAATDPLTGLANRRAFNRALERRFAEAQRYGHDLSCVMVDLDGFKALNDTLGHQRGDELLQKAGRVLVAACRRSDMPGRYGGDEFVVLLPQTDLITAEQVANRIAQEFAATVAAMLGGVAGAPKVSMSMGLASLHGSRPASGEQLIAHADHALYRAKQTGRDRVAVYSPAPGQGEGTPAAAPIVRG